MGAHVKETPPDLSSEAAHALVIASHTHRETVQTVPE